MYVTQDADRQLTVVNPEVALRIALQGISGIVSFLVMHKYETQRAATTLLYDYPLSHAFVSLSHLRFISNQFFQFSVALLKLSDLSTITRN